MGLGLSVGVSLNLTGNQLHRIHVVPGEPERGGDFEVKVEAFAHTVLLCTGFKAGIGVGSLVERPDGQEFYVGHFNDNEHSLETVGGRKMGGLEDGNHLGANPTLEFPVGGRHDTFNHVFVEIYTKFVQCFSGENLVQNVRVKCIDQRTNRAPIILVTEGAILSNGPFPVVHDGEQVVELL